MKQLFLNIFLFIYKIQNLNLKKKNVFFLLIHSKFETIISAPCQMSDK